MTLPLLEVRNLVTEFRVEGGIARAVAGVSFKVHEGEKLGIVGESGSGKSVTALSILRLIPDPPGKIAGGEILFKGKDLLKFSYPQMRTIRGNEISMIFQEPMTSLNPVFTIGMQVAEVIELHQKVSHEEAMKRAAKALESVGIPDAIQRLGSYPHEFSGGMRQRVMIAMALACNPKLLLADEPTTALDVTVQAQILDLMAALKQKSPESAVILITHDLAVVAEFCDRVLVMYGGKIQECAEVVELFKSPLHPYTQGLMKSIPNPDTPDEKQPLYAIPGTVPNILEMPPGCRFANRCDRAEARCHTQEPVLVDAGGGHQVRCHLVRGIPCE